MHINFKSIKQKVHLLLENLLQAGYLSIGFVLLLLLLLTFIRVVLLKPDFDCWSNFVLSWVDKFTTETKFCVTYYKKCYFVPLKNDKIHGPS